MASRPLTIGVTFFLRKGDRSIWSNGADQNCVFLWRILQRCAEVGKVYAINGGDGDAPPPGMMLAGLGIEFVRLADVEGELDVLVEAGAQVEAAAIARIRARGGRAVAYRFGNAMVLDAERVIHGKDSGSIFNGSCFDAVWTNPQHVHTCASYWETCYRAPVRVLPHIWDPTFVDAAVAEFPADLPWGYQPGRRPWAVMIAEPNINIVKTCTIPLLVCEEAYRRRPDLLSEVYVTNALHLKDHLTFQHFVANLDLQKDKRVSFEGRFNTPYFMAKFADVMVAHQWENGLNYAYYDALHGGYPVVHNSELLPDGVGYRYSGFDARDGGDVLVAALLSHEGQAEAYRARAQAFLETVWTSHPANVAAHEQALAALWERS